MKGNRVMVNKLLLLSVLLGDENEEVESLCVSVWKQQQQKTFSQQKNAFDYHFARENHFGNHHPSGTLQRMGAFSDMSNNVPIELI